VLLLRVDVGVEVGLACLDARLDALQRVPALLHVALDLPRELDLRAEGFFFLFFFLFFYPPGFAQ
jgi:hypothetical protein